MFEPVLIERLTALPAGLAERLFPDDSAIPGDIDRRVAEIIERVRREGDRALSDYSERFDGIWLEPGSFHLSVEQVHAVAEGAPESLRRAIDGMIVNVERFHRPQLRGGFTLEGPDGSQLTWRLRPVESVAVYVPGGKAAYPSTVVMNVVPARIAGVPRIVVLTPPRSVERNPTIAYALQALEVDEVITLGGAHAIAAVAHGTGSIAPVDLIVGPGNIYVAAAKRRLFGKVGIDAIAGPSEVVVLADDTAPVEWVVQDLMAQAEHDELARCILITPSWALAQAVRDRIDSASAATPRAEVVRVALRARGANCVVPDLVLGVSLVNRIAPEHLQVMVDEAAGLSPEDFVAGAVFWGPHSPTAIGDYWAGPNHVLPTGGTARFRGPLGVRDFLVPTSVIRYSEQAARTRLELARVLAEVEGLWAHAASLACRAAPDAQENGES